MANKRDYQTGLLASDDFEDRAGDRLKLARELGSEVKLTLMEIVGLKELAESLPAEESRALMSDVGALLRGQSIGGDTAARLDPEKYGILHATPFDQEAVTEQVRNLVRRSGPAATAAEAVGVRGATPDLPSKGLGDEDAA